MNTRATMAMIRYVTLSVLTYITGWLDQLKDVALAAITWNQWATLIIGCLTTALVAIGAVMNQSWKPKDSTTSPVTS